jgi:hypothetical protein
MSVRQGGHSIARLEAQKTGFLVYTDFSVSPNRRQFVAVSNSSYLVIYSRVR